MHYQTEYAMSQAAISDATPIRCKLQDNGYYLLTSAKGEKRTIAAGSANTALANAGWPKRGHNAVLWMYARPV